MKKRAINRAFVWIVIAWLFTSCRQTLIIHESMVLEETDRRINTIDFVKNSLLGSDFAISLVIYLLIAFLVWQFGYRFLEWFRKLGISAKVTCIIVSLAALYVAGGVSHDIGQQQYGMWFAIPITMTVGSTLVVVVALYHRMRFYLSLRDKERNMPDGYRRQRNLQLLAKTMVWIWSCGWVIYFIAIGIANQPHVGSEVLLRSAVASLDLFWMDIDSNILDAIKDHDVLKGTIACASFTAVVCLATLVTSLVLSRLMSYMHIRHIRLDGTYNHLYVFFGLDEASMSLANDVYRSDEHSVIVFVENSLAGEAEQDEDKTDGWKNIVSMLTHRRKTFLDAAEDDRRALAIASCDICSLEGNEDDVLGHVGLDTVKKLLLKLKSTGEGELHVFFLSENREKNARSTVLLANDELVGSKEFKTIINCHARRNSVNKILEDMNLGQEKNMEVKVIDSSFLAIEHLKSDAKTHPVNFVAVEPLASVNPGSVSTPFVSLVMGFGETGQEAVRFLYEFASFVDYRSDPNHSFRSPFTCHVVDMDLNKLEGEFMANTPGVSYKRCDAMDLLEPVKFYDYDYRSDEFFSNVLSKIAKDLNYVVVSTGNDETNIAVAVDILTYVRKHRKDLDNFCIYVRVYENGKYKHLREIANHYNKRLRKDPEEDIEKIVLFGNYEQIFTYSLIVKDVYKENARQYYNTYRSLQLDPSNDEGDWDKRHWDTMGKKSVTKWERMSKIRRKESQDRSNALHRHTKITLLENAVGKSETENYALRALAGRVGEQASIYYPHLNSQENRLMMNLAMCEHLRWNAAHEMMGYVNNTEEHKCDERLKRHNCLKPWQELDSESENAGYKVDYKLFDYGVVETSFKLKYDPTKP